MREGDHEVRDSEEGWTLGRWLRERFILGPRTAHELASSGRLSCEGRAVSDPGRRMRAGEFFRLGREGKGIGGGQSRQSVMPNGRIREEGVPIGGGGNRTLAIEYLDDHMVVVQKPSGLTTCRSPREASEHGERARGFLPSTLHELLRRHLSGHPQAPLPRIWPVHRLDQDTSGLVVFALNPQAAKHLGQQFREHGIVRRYWAVTRGDAVEQTIRSHLVQDRGDGRRGTGPEGPDSRHAVTTVRVIQRFMGFTWVECVLETGRTHQIRVHLGEAGTPLCAERIYDRPLHGGPRPDGANFPRMALHAHTLGVVHPATGREMRWHAPWPPDLLIPLNQLANQAGEVLAAPKVD